MGQALRFPCHIQYIEYTKNILKTPSLFSSGEGFFSWSENAWGGGSVSGEKMGELDKVTGVPTHRKSIKNRGKEVEIFGWFSVYIILHAK